MRASHRIPVTVRLRDHDKIALAYTPTAADWRSAAIRAWKRLTGKRGTWNIALCTCHAPGVFTAQFGTPATGCGTLLEPECVIHVG